jgi:hypothetical protein
MTITSLIKHKDNLLASIKSEPGDDKSFIMDMIYLNIKEIYLKKSSLAVYVYRELCTKAIDMGWAKSNQDFFQQMIVNKLLPEERNFHTSLINRMALLRGNNVAEDFSDFRCDKVAQLLVNYSRQPDLNKEKVPKNSTESVQCLFNLYKASLIYNEGEPAIINKIIQKAYALCANENEQKNLQQLFTTAHLKNILSPNSLNKSASENETILNGFQYMMLNDFKPGFFSETSKIKEFNNFIDALKALPEQKLSKEEINAFLDKHEPYIQVLYEKDDNDYCLNIEKSFATHRALATVLLTLIENDQHKPWVEDLRRSLSGVFSEMDEKFRSLKKIILSEEGTEKEIANSLRDLADIQPLFADVGFNPLNHPVVQLIFNRQFSDDYLQIFHAMFEDNASILKLTKSINLKGLKI